MRRILSFANHSVKYSFYGAMSPLNELRFHKKTSYAFPVRQTFLKQLGHVLVIAIFHQNIRDVF